MSSIPSVAAAAAAEGGKPDTGYLQHRESEWRDSMKGRVVGVAGGQRMR